jgi:hypothetical protein
MSIQEFAAQPKTVTEMYRNELITVRYNPDKKMWHWTFVVVPVPMTFEDDAISVGAALRAARRMVDTVNGSPI